LLLVVNKIIGQKKGGVKKSHFYDVDPTILGCATNLWKRLSCRPPFPEVFPAVTQLTASQGDNIIGAADTPVHA